jgi:hypothetical protein
VQILDFFAITMPPRKRKAIGQVQSNAKERKQRREETSEGRNRRLSALRETAATCRGLETVQQREDQLQDKRDGATSRASETVQQREAPTT